MMVLGVVPGEEILTESPGILNRAEISGEIRTIFEGFKLRFRIGIIIAHVRTRMAFCYPQIREKKCHGLRCHAWPTISVDRQLFWFDNLFLTGISDETLCQNCLFTMRDHPANHVTAEDIKNDIEVEIGPFCRSFELRYIPGPYLIRSRGQKLRFLIIGQE